MDTTPRPDQQPTLNEAASKAATAARIYDYYIGGTHNFPADRAAAEAAIAQVPVIREAALANRAFLGRAVSFAAASGSSSISVRAFRPRATCTRSHRTLIPKRAWST